MGGGGILPGATDVAFESTFDSDSGSLICDSSSSSTTTTTAAGLAFTFTVVLVLEAFDFEDTLDRSSSAFGLPNPTLLVPANHDLCDDWEFDLDCDVASSRSWEVRDGVTFLCENSVSGGLGGLASFAACGLLVGFTYSVDLGLGSSSDPSAVVSGVRGSFAGVTLWMLSVLLTASFECALENEGYGRLDLEEAPGADKVLASSGTISDIEEVGSDSTVFSLRLR
jgi:hypothetical protein